MNQQMLDMRQWGPWLETHKGDVSGRMLADRHYSRQTIGHPMYTRPGDNFVLRTADGMAVWVSWRSKHRDDGYEAWECTLFRNESGILSSDMIRAAAQATIAKWGGVPPDGMITYVAADKIRSTNPGCCFKKAGWKRIGKSKHRGLILLQYTFEDGGSTE